MTDGTISLLSISRLEREILRITPAGQVLARSEDGRMVPIKLGRDRVAALAASHDHIAALAVLAAELAERDEAAGTP